MFFLSKCIFSCYCVVVHLILVIHGYTVIISYRYGEVVNINLVRDKGTGKSRGFCFICYEDQRSTNLAVDNFNGVKVSSKIFWFLLLPTQNFYLLIFYFLVIRFLTEL